MDILGLGFIVDGAALLCSGLIFLLPRERDAISSQQSFEENLDEIKRHLSQMRRVRGD